MTCLAKVNRTYQISLVRCVHLVNGGQHLRSKFERGSNIMASSAISRAGLGDRAVALPPSDLIFGRSATMQTARQKIDKVALSGVPILIQGDNGTGKGLLAAYIHSLSPIPGTSFVKVNCAAIPGALLESELF
jgi:transcriptional regulator with PAS, ATPase and Fis domain